MVIRLPNQNAHELKFATGDIRNIHVMGRRAKFFQLLAGKNVKSNKMNFGVTVFASFGRGHINDLAGAAFDHNEAVLAQGRALHRVGGRSTGISAIEGMLMLQSTNIS